MADVNKKIPDDILELISGGHEEKVSDISQCPPGTIECKNADDWPQHEGHHKHCINDNCHRKDSVHDQNFYVPDWGVWISGQKCDACGTYWI